MTSMNYFDSSRKNLTYTFEWKSVIIGILRFWIVLFFMHIKIFYVHEVLGVNQKVPAELSFILIN
jgi:hypothetical protein